MFAAKYRKQLTILLRFAKTPRLEKKTGIRAVYRARAQGDAAEHSGGFAADSYRLAQQLA